MTEFAQFIALSGSDAAFNLPAPGSPDDNEATRSFGFDLPALDRQRPIIIMFKVAVWIDVNLQMIVNDDSGPLVDFRLISPLQPVQPRSWLEIVDGTGFRATGNVLRVRAQRNPHPEVGPFGYIQVSDIVILYPAVTPEPLGEVRPMSDFAQFIALPGTASAFDVSGDDSRSFRFDLPGLDRQRTVIIMFKFAAYFHARLQMTVNGEATPIINFPFYSPAAPLQPRTWHEIVQGNVFSETGNFLVITADNEEDYAYMQVSDITFLYHVHTGTAGEAQS